MYRLGAVTSDTRNGKKMVIVKILGGLGNQMFQYAAGRSLALRNSCLLKLDISAFDGYKLHNGYELGLCNIGAEIASRAEVSQLVGSSNRLIRRIRQKAGLTKKTHYVERDFSFDAQVAEIKPPVYLEGYWQSYKYFAPYEAQLRNELSFKNPPSEENLDLANKMTGGSSVSIHVRRGDYVSHRATSQIHGSKSAAYYTKAIQYLQNEVEAPHFYVFSDDLEWAKNNLGLQGAVTYVSHNTGKSSFEDLRLMSLCRHNIIANSSFSWWGAWLNENQDKMVIYPRKWFNSARLNVKDLIPPSWVAVDG